MALLSKQQLREQRLAMRRALPKEEQETRSAEIVEAIKELEQFKSAESILTFVSLPGEVLVDSLLGSKKQVLLPGIDNGGIAMLRYEGQLVKGLYGTRQPPFDEKKVASRADIALVPGVAFDAKGNRLGHGKGYYDRLLSRVPAFKVGVAFDAQLVDAVPVEPHDVRMDLIVTESRVIRC